MISNEHEIFNPEIRELVNAVIYRREPAAVRRALIKRDNGVFSANIHLKTCVRPGFFIKRPPAEARNSCQQSCYFASKEQMLNAIFGADDTENNPNFALKAEFKLCYF